MKLFAIIAKVELVKPPQWLELFRAKYDDPWEPHITLRQPTWIEDFEVAGVQQIVADVMAKHSEQTLSMLVTFAGVNLSPKDPLNPLKGNSIIVNAAECLLLTQVQQDLVVALREYRQYLKPHAQAYDLNFRPHQTIARHLDDDQYKQAQRDLPNDVQFSGQVHEIVLNIMEKHGVEAANNPFDQTVYPI